MINVLIVDDSLVARDFLSAIVSADPAIRVVGTAVNGKEAVQAVKDLRPDLVMMDVVMPLMDGLEATRIIMETTPLPIVIVSASWNRAEVDKTFLAMEAGALAAVQKPVGAAHPQHARLAEELVRTVKLMSEVRVIRRQSRSRRQAEVRGGAEAAVAAVVPPGAKAPKLVAIGASTGGPGAINEILSGLPKGFSAPVLIVQHIAAGFVPGFAGWLAGSSGLPVKIAAQGEIPQPGHVYVAPDDLQMGVGGNRSIMLRKDEPENRLRPSVSYLFRSIAQVFGKNAVGVLLSGMGKDGARELKLLRDAGAVTIAQDEKSCVVYGMPGEAVALDAASYVLPPAKIAELLSSFSAGAHAKPVR